jgi:hypothetical protein
MLFMDVHRHMQGITKDQLAAAHQRDLELQGSEGVKFVKAWADPKSGCVFCLAEGPDRDAVARVHAKAGHPAEELYEVPLVVE